MAKQQIAQRTGELQKGMAVELATMAYTLDLKTELLKVAGSMVTCNTDADCADLPTSCCPHYGPGPSPGEVLKLVDTELDDLEVKITKSSKSKWSQIEIDEIGDPKQQKNWNHWGCNWLRCLSTGAFFRCLSYMEVWLWLLQIRLPRGTDLAPGEHSNHPRPLQLFREPYSDHFDNLVFQIQLML